MAPPDSKDPYLNSRLWIHVKILHGCLLFVIAGTICGFWICLSELQNLRRDLDAEIAKRAMVEFNAPEGFMENRNGQNSNRKHDNSTPYTREIIFGLHEEELYPEEGEHALPEAEGEEEQLLRVKRRANRRSNRRNAHYKEGGSGTQGGAGAPEDWVWLTSYSRIPVSIKIIPLAFSSLFNSAS